MRYAFLLYADDTTRGDVDPGESLAAFRTYIGALQEAGVFVATDWLRPADTATTVSTAGGEAVVQDGPFAITQESLGGFFIVDVPDLDAALAWAKECPAAKYGKVEVRASALPG